VKDISRSRWATSTSGSTKRKKKSMRRRQSAPARGDLFWPAQFRVGGFVDGGGGAIPSWFASSAMHFAGGGAVPAILHEGEFVMRKEAVNIIGRENLANMNAGGGSGGSGGDVHFHIEINAVDAKSVRNF